MAAFEKAFKVIDQVRVRTAPALQSDHVTWLNVGARILADPDSRTEADGYIWWHHSVGWSAERTVDGTEVYLTLEAPAGSSAPSADSGGTVIYQVGERQVRVRSGPSLSADHVTWLNPGQAVRVEPDSRTEADGFEWWKHSAGWSAVQMLNGSKIYMTRVKARQTAPLPPLPEEAPASTPEPAPAAPAGSSEQAVFKIGPQQVRVRAAPTFSGDHVGWLDPDQQVTMRPDSRTEAEGYVWWQHDAGWSVERMLDGSKVYMTRVEGAAETPAEPAPAEEAPPIFIPASEGTPPAQPETMTLIVGRQQVRVRSGPTLSAAHVRWLLPGEQITVKTASRTEANDYVWYQHDEGWSVSQTVDGKEKLLFDPKEFAERPDQQGPVFSGGLPDVDTLPMREGIFTRLPLALDQTRWWQYFGNNVFGYNLWASGKTWYAYSQGLHGGLDFGNSSSAATVVAGATGVFVKRDTAYTKPNGMWIKVGDYTVIYGHLANPANLAPGAAIGPDTVMGTIDLGGQNHLHLEIRYKGRWILNPLLFMPEDMRNSLIKKFPAGPEYFYKDDTWDKWQTPFDQPVLVLGGDLIGPHAR
jgi:hypothetical protein